MYVCMWNGTEDLYIQTTGESLPPKFFFVLASFGSFCYMKTNKSDIKRMIALGDGRTRKMYEFLSPIVGFEYKVYECKTFDKALYKIKKEIDDGFPCMIGALDMYYLPHFEKIYHHDHIPFHYELAIGYDDEEKKLYFLDCGREKMQSISYEELALAFDCSYPGLSKPNTVWSIRMNAGKNKYKIAKEALSIRKEQFLNPPVSFIGYKGMEKLIDEIPHWYDELEKEEIDKILFNFVQFLGTVPTIPNKLLGIDRPDEMEFGGGFDKAAIVLKSIGQEFNDEGMLKTANVFEMVVPTIGEIKEEIVSYLTNESQNFSRLANLLTIVKDAMIKGFQYL